MLLVNHPMMSIPVPKPWKGFLFFCYCICIKPIPTIKNLCNATLHICCFCVDLLMQSLIENIFQFPTQPQKYRRCQKSWHTSKYIQKRSWQNLFKLSSSRTFDFYFMVDIFNLRIDYLLPNLDLLSSWNTSWIPK